MNLSTYPSRIFALLFFCSCMDKNEQISKEKKEDYIRNDYQIGKVQAFDEMISIQVSPNRITDLRKKLIERIPKWSTTGTEKKPYEIWHNFYRQETAKHIIQKLQTQGYDTTLLENYYHSLGNLFKETTEKNEQALIASMEKLQTNTKLVQAWKKALAIYNHPETIYLSEATLEYKEFLDFILNKPTIHSTLHIKLKRLQLDLAQWNEERHGTGLELWKRVQDQEANLLKDTPVYEFEENKKAIEESLRLIDGLAEHPYGLSYKDLLETLPHGIKQLNRILDKLQLQGAKSTKLLKAYLKLIERFYENIRELS